MNSADGGLIGRLLRDQDVDALAELALNLARDSEEARGIAKNLLQIVETYIRLDVAAPRRIRDLAAEARERVKEWEEKR